MSIHGWFKFFFLGQVILKLTWLGKWFVLLQKIGVLLSFGLLWASKDRNLITFLLFTIHFFQFMNIFVEIVIWNLTRCLGTICWFILRILLSLRVHIFFNVPNHLFYPFFFIIWVYTIAELLCITSGYMCTYLITLLGWLGIVITLRSFLIFEELCCYLLL